MFKILFFVSLFSVQAFAAAPLLEKHVTSGYTMPEHMFKYDCSITSDRRIVVTKRKGSHEPQTTISRLSWKALYTIKALARFASRGHITDLPVMCDAGSKLTYGYHYGMRFIVDEDRDCSSHKINESRSAAKLKSLATTYCGF